MSEKITVKSLLPGVMNDYIRQTVRQFNNGEIKVNKAEFCHSITLYGDMHLQSNRYELKPIGDTVEVYEFDKHTLTLIWQDTNPDDLRFIKYPEQPSMW